MTQAAEAPASATERTITLNLRRRLDEQGESMLWFVSWVVGDDGEEGEWFYSGVDSASGAYQAPANAIGLRIRRWPSPGTDPEYVDLPLNSEAAQTVTDRGLQFDRRQPHSRLTFD